MSLGGGNMNVFKYFRSNFTLMLNVVMCQGTPKPVYTHRGEETAGDLSKTVKLLLQTQILDTWLRLANT